MPPLQSGSEVKLQELDSRFSIDPFDEKEHHPNLPAKANRRRRRKEQRQRRKGARRSSSEDEDSGWEVEPQYQFADWTRPWAVVVAERQAAEARVAQETVERERTDATAREVDVAKTLPVGEAMEGIESKREIPAEEAQQSRKEDGRRILGSHTRHTTAFREAVSLFAETFTALSTRFLSGTVAQAAYLAIVAATFAFAATSQAAFPFALFTWSFLLSGTVAQAVHLAVAQAAYLAIVATTFAFAAISQAAFPFALFTWSSLLSRTVAQAVHLAVAQAAYLAIVATTFAFAAISQAAFPFALFTRSSFSLGPCAGGPSHGRACGLSRDRGGNVRLCRDLSGGVPARPLHAVVPSPRNRRGDSGCPCIDDSVSI
ncbi:hypothetical protein A0H81_03291 [Grifola frondosa]|uniref:Uncharacterized protein n=1 Tax=Grifola frondosa TaxID=5627 RepID=A0A1C7MGR2_GRIFR|nr:hypothetical protein A0H81_03291 [Grifola frondosa]